MVAISPIAAVRASPDAAGGASSPHVASPPAGLTPPAFLAATRPASPPVPRPRSPVAMTPPQPQLQRLRTTPACAPWAQELPRFHREIDEAVRACETRLSAQIEERIAAAAEATDRRVGRQLLDNAEVLRGITAHWQELARQMQDEEGRRLASAAESSAALNYRIETEKSAREAAIGDLRTALEELTGKNTDVGVATQVAAVEDLESRLQANIDELRDDVAATEQIASLQDSVEKCVVELAEVVTTVEESQEQLKHEFQEEIRDVEKRFSALYQAHRDFDKSDLVDQLCCASAQAAAARCEELLRPLRETAAARTASLRPEEGGGGQQQEFDDEYIQGLMREALLEYDRELARDLRLSFAPVNSPTRDAGALAAPSKTTLRMRPALEVIASQLHALMYSSKAELKLVVARCEQISNELELRHVTRLQAFEHINTELENPNTEVASIDCSDPTLSPALLVKQPPELAGNEESSHTAPTLTELCRAELQK